MINYSHAENMKRWTMISYETIKYDDDMTAVAAPHNSAVHQAALLKIIFENMVNTVIWEDSAVSQATLLK